MLNRFKRYFHPIAMLQLAVLALGLNLLIEILSRRSLISALLSILTQPLFFLFGTLFIALTLTVSGLFRHRTFALMLLSLGWVVLGIINCVLMCIRNSPLCGVDFYILSTGLSIVTVYLSLFQILLIAFSILLALLGLVVIYRKVPKKPIRMRTALLHIASTLGILVILTVSANSVDALPDQFSGMTDAYEDYGFVYCFTQTVFDRGIEMPEDYNEESVDAILSILEESADESLPSDQFPNLIFVQLESFFDITALQDITLSEDPTPYFNFLKTENPSGFLTVPSVGGGTANTEFEVLTGMDLAFFGIGEYPYNTILRKEALPSLAYQLKSMGYSAHVFHNHEGSFYDRNLVYPNLGFDTFTSIEYMNGYETNPLGWCDDSILTSEILSAMEATKEKDFLFAVSVQCHGKYPLDYTPDADGIRVSGISDPQLLSQYSFYADQLRQVDDFIRELTTALSAVDEGVILVLYGDHLPSLNLTADDLPDGQTLYQTEYVIWSNYKDLPNTSIDLDCSALGAMALSHCGIHDGALTRLHQTMADRSCYQTWLHTLQYDLVHGEQKSLDFECLPTDITMGRTPILIDQVINSENGLIVYGSGFTAHSTICINGWRMETEFLSDHQLIAPNALAHNRDAVTVVQLSASGSELSETKPLRFYEPPKKASSKPDPIIGDTP